MQPETANWIPYNDELNHSQLLPKLGRVLGSAQSIDLPPEGVDSGVDLEHARRDGLRRILLAGDEIAPAGFQILKAHPSDWPNSPGETATRTRTRTATTVLPVESGAIVARIERD